MMEKARLPWWWLAAAAGLALLAQSAVVEADRLRIAGVSLPDLCPVRSWGGRCLGCGLTRSSVLLAQGSWRAAWSAHPGAFALLGVVLLETSAMLWSPRARRSARWALAALLLLLSILHWASSSI